MCLSVVSRSVCLCMLSNGALVVVRFTHFVSHTHTHIHASHSLIHSFIDSVSQSVSGVRLDLTGNRVAHYRTNTHTQTHTHTYRPMSSSWVMSSNCGTITYNNNKNIFMWISVHSTLNKSNIYHHHHHHPHWKIRIYPSIRYHSLQCNINSVPELRGLFIAILLLLWLIFYSSNVVVIHAKLDQTGSTCAIVARPEQGRKSGRWSVWWRHHRL